VINNVIKNIIINELTPLSFDNQINVGSGGLAFTAISINSLYALDHGSNTKYIKDNNIKCIKVYFIILLFGTLSVPNIFKSFLNKTISGTISQTYLKIGIEVLYITTIADRIIKVKIIQIDIIFFILLFS